MNDTPTPPPDVQSLFDETYEPPDTAAIPLGDTSELTDHTVEESLRRSKEQELGVYVPAQPATIPAPINNPAIMEEAAGAAARAEASFQDTIDETKIEVTDADKDRFIRAALHDTEMVFDIAIDGLDMVVQVAMPSEAFTAAAQTVTKAWHDSNDINLESGSIQFLVAFQQIHMWHQVRAINGEPVGWAWNEDENGPPTIPNIRKFASTYANLAQVVNMNSLRYRVLMRAMMIAEVKYKLCLQALHDRSFFTGAATD